MKAKAVNGDAVKVRMRRKKQKYCNDVDVEKTVHINAIVSSANGTYFLVVYSTVSYIIAYRQPSHIKVANAICKSNQ